MNGCEAGAILDLLSAGSARSGDDDGCCALLLHGLPDGREQHHLADGKTGLVVFLLVAERAGHTAAATRNDIHLRMEQTAQHLSRLLHAHQPPHFCYNDPDRRGRPLHDEQTSWAYQRPHHGDLCRRGDGEESGCREPD